MSTGWSGTGTLVRPVGRYRVPTGAPHAVRWFVDALWAPRSRRQRWLGRLAARMPPAVALAILARSAPAGDLPVVSSVARRLLDGALGDAAAGACTLGWTGYAGTGRALEFVFPAGGRQPRWVIKWGRLGAARRLADERARLEEVRARLGGKPGEELVATLPAPLASGVDGMHEWLLLGALPGRTIDADLARAPRDSARRTRHLELGAAWLARFHRVTGCGGESRSESAAALRAFGGELEPLARAVAAGDVPCAASHGDFWPRNVLVAPDLGRVSGVVDWESARLGEPPHRDLFDFLLSYAALLAPGGEAERAVAAFRLAILAPDALAGAARGCLDAYAEAAGLAPRWLEPLFRLYLAELAAGARELRLVPAPDRPEVTRTWIALYATAQRSVFSG